MDVITFPTNLLTTSGLSILLHNVISLPDARRHVIIYFSGQNLALDTAVVNTKCSVPMAVFSILMFHRIQSFQYDGRTFRQSF